MLHGHGKTTWNIYQNAILLYMYYFYYYSVVVVGQDSQKDAEKDSSFSLISSTLNASLLKVHCDAHVWELFCCSFTGRIPHLFSWRQMLQVLSFFIQFFLRHTQAGWEMYSLRCFPGLPWSLLRAEHPWKIAPDVHLGGLLSRCPNCIIWLLWIPKSSSSTFGPFQTISTLSISTTWNTQTQSLSILLHLS